jgi:hypothetical protein
MKTVTLSPLKEQITCLYGLRAYKNHDAVKDEMLHNPLQTFFPPCLQLLLFIFTWNIFSQTLHFWHPGFNRAIAIVSRRHWTGKANDNAALQLVICLWQAVCPLNVGSKYIISSVTSLVIRKMSIVGTTRPLCDDHRMITEILTKFHPSTPIPTSFTLPLKSHSETDWIMIL